MMKKFALAILLVASLFSMAHADEDTTATRQLDHLETIIYGTLHKGSLMGRLEEIEKDLYGTSLQGTLAERQSAHIDFLENGSNGQPSLLFKMSVAEWGLEVLNNADRPLIERVPILEKHLEGNAMLDKPLAMRVERIIGMILSEPVTAVPVELPAGIVARLQLMETLRPADTKKGDSVLFRLTHNIAIGDNLVVPAGAPARATVKSVKKPRSFGRPSEIHLALESLMTLGRDQLLLTDGEASRQATEFEASYAAAAGTSLVGAIALGPVGLAGGFFIRGNAKDVPAGSVMYAETETPVTVPAFPVPEFLKKRLAENKYVDILTGQAVEIQKPEIAPDGPKNPPEPPKGESEIDNL